MHQTAILRTLKPSSRNSDWSMAAAVGGAFSGRHSHVRCPLCGYWQCHRCAATITEEEPWGLVVTLACVGFRGLDDADTQPMELMSPVAEG